MATDAVRLLRENAPQRAVKATGTTMSGPHEFTPLAWRDRWGRKARCRHCYFPRFLHPVSWVPSRSLGDRKKPYGTGKARPEPPDQAQALGA